MFDHYCTHCDARQLIFPSQVTSLTNTDQGIVLAFTCWCGTEQTKTTGLTSERHAKVALAA